MLSRVLVHYVHYESVQRVRRRSNDQLEKRRLLKNIRFFIGIKKIFLYYFFETTKSLKLFVQKRYPDPTKELPILKNTVLNCEVKLIDYSGKGTPVKITTTNGKIFEADHVIVTVSLGVLKDKHQTLFKPNLSDVKVSAIQVVNKFTLSHHIEEVIL